MNIKNNPKLIDYCLSISLLAILVAAALPLLMVKWPYTPYLFAVGAAGALVARIFETYKGESLRIRRLYRMGKVSAMCYVVAAGLMFYQPSARDWLAFLTVGAVLQVYSTFMIMHEEKKLGKNASGNNKA